jgi:ABC-type branched-subunit amino acid transport system substrate-binding protein
VRSRYEHTTQEGGVKTVHDSLLLAVEQINDAGGVLGKKLQVVTEDGACG